MTNPRADWRDTLKIGDILITPSGNWRVVRAVSYWPTEGRYPSRHGLLGSIDLAIRRCSWTNRAFTTKSRAYIAKYTKLDGVRAKLNTEADKKLYEDIMSKTTKQYYDCCAAKMFL